MDYGRYDYVMNLKDAEQLARTLMDDHGLHHVPFRWNRGKRMLGLTRILKNRATGEHTVMSISLSEHFVKLLPEDEIRDVILHEIAHALTPGHGHDYVWKRKAREIGAKPERCASPSARPETNVVGVCPNGHETSGKHRLPLVFRTCGKCSRTFNLDYALTWKKNGQVVPLSSMPERYRSQYRRIVERVKS